MCGGAGRWIWYLGRVEVEEFAMRRRLVVRAGLAVLIAVGVFALWPRTDRVTRANFDRLRIGMSRAEVEALLGPPADYTTVPLHNPWCGPDDVDSAVDLSNESVARAPADGLSLWATDQALVLTTYDPDDMLADPGFLPCTRLPQSALNNLLWRAKRQWHRWFP